jgi:hypothetical protein
MALRESVEPRVAMSSTANDDPNLQTPNTDMEQPNRANDLKEIDDPKFT